jgi:hypothetical protein
VLKELNKFEAIANLLLTELLLFIIISMRIVSAEPAPFSHIMSTAIVTDD